MSLGSGHRHLVPESRRGSAAEERDSESDSESESLSFGEPGK